MKTKDFLLIILIVINLVYSIPLFSSTSNIFDDNGQEISDQFMNLDEMPVKKDRRYYYFKIHSAGLPFAHLKIKEQQSFRLHFSSKVIDISRCSLSV